MTAQMPSEAADRILKLLEDNQYSLYGSDAQLFYGDQRRIGVTPTVCVEPGPVQRSLVGALNRTENQIVCFIIIYYAKVDSNQNTKRAADVLGEDTARFLDGNLTLERQSDGGIVIHGFVTEINPGYSYKNGDNLYHAVRLTWTGKSKTMLGA